MVLGISRCKTVSITGGGGCTNDATTAIAKARDRDGYNNIEWLLQCILNIFFYVNQLNRYLHWRYQRVNLYNFPSLHIDTSAWERFEDRSSKPWRNNPRRYNIFLLFKRKTNCFVRCEVYNNYYNNHPVVIDRPIFFLTPRHHCRRFIFLYGRLQVYNA